MFLKFLKSISILFLGCSFMSFILCVLHTNYNPTTATKVYKKKDSLALEKITIEGIFIKKFDYRIFYLHATFIWIFLIYIFYLLSMVWNDYYKVLRNWYSTEEFHKSHNNKTLLFSGLTENLQFEPDLRAYLDRFNLPFEPKFIAIGRDTSILTRKIKEHSNYTVKLEEAIIKMSSSQDPKRPTHVEGFSWFRRKQGERVDSISFYSSNILALEKEIYAIQMTGNQVLKPSSFGFVSFESPLAARKCLSILKNPLNRKQLIAPSVRIAPDYSDLFWINVDQSIPLSRTRGILGMGLTLLLTFFWSIIIVPILALTQLDQINETYPNLSNNNPSLIIFITSILGPLLLAIFNMLLPLILRIISIFQGVKTYSGIEKSVLLKYMFFLAYQFFLAIGLSAAAETLIAYNWNNANANENLPELYISILTALASGALKTSTTFTILAISNLVAMSFSIAQIWPLIYNFAIKRIFLNTPRREFELNKPDGFDYAVLYGTFLYIFMYSLSYLVSAPLIILFTTLVFSFSYIIMKYQLLYVNETLIETGGSWWPKVFNLIMIFVFIALFLNISVLVTTLWTSKTANSQGPAIFAAITLFLLLLFWFYYSVIFEPKCRILFEQDQDVLRRPSIASNESINFETQVFNPVLEKTLKKVWLPNALKDTLNSYHTVEFESLQDYINVMRPLNSPDSLIDLRSSMVRKREREAAKSALRRMDSLKIPVEIGGELEGLNISALNTPSDSMGDLNNSDVDLLRYVSVDEIEMGGLK